MHFALSSVCILLMYSEYILINTLHIITLQSGYSIQKRREGGIAGEIGAKYGALTAKVCPHVGDIVISILICEVYNNRSREDHEVSAFLL